MIHSIYKGLELNYQNHDCNVMGFDVEKKLSVMESEMEYFFFLNFCSYIFVGTKTTFHTKSKMVQYQNDKYNSIIC